jgi:hypothetical protein
MNERYEEVWHVLWLGEPFMDQTLVGKLSRRMMTICEHFDL